MIELSAKIKAYDNGATFNSVNLTTEHAGNAMGGDPMILSQLVNNKRSDAFYRFQSRPYFAYRAFVNIPAGLVEYSMNDMVFVKPDRGNMMSNPIINIVSDNPFSELLLKFGTTNYPRRMILLYGNKRTRDTSFRFERTGRTLDRLSEYVVEYDMPNSATTHIIESVDTKVSSSFAYPVRLQDKTYIFLYIDSHTTTTSVTLFINYRDNYKEISTSSYFSRVTLDTPVNDLSIMIMGHLMRTYSFDINSIISQYDIYTNSVNLKKLSSNIVDREDLELPSYGIVSNSSDIEFVDKEREMEQLYGLGLLESRSPIEIYLENTLTQKMERIDNAYVQDWDYDRYDFVATAKIQDDLEDWQYLQVKKLDVGSRTLYDVFDLLRLATPSKWEFEALDSKTEALLKNTTCPNSYIKEGSLWSQWTKLCQVGGLHIYKKNGKVVVKHGI